MAEWSGIWFAKPYYIGSIPIMAFKERKQMQRKLSVILPTIHSDKIITVYESIKKSFSDDFEFIIVSPYPLPDNMKDKSNVLYINDWGSPMRCQQIGLIHASGDYITRAVDDGVYLKDELSNALLKLMVDSPDNSAIILKHTETNKDVDTTHKDFQNMANPDFFNLTYHHQTLKPYVPAHFKIMNFGIVSRETLISIGGWNTIYETPALGELDLSIRLQMSGINFILSDNIVVSCGWTPGTEGTHAPMHYGFEEDMKTYTKVYSNPECENFVIDLDNWKKSPEKWQRRFGN